MEQLPELLPVQIKVRRPKKCTARCTAAASSGYTTLRTITRARHVISQRNAPGSLKDNCKLRARNYATTTFTTDITTT